MICFAWKVCLQRKDCDVSVLICRAPDCAHVKQFMLTCRRKQAENTKAVFTTQRADAALSIALPSTPPVRDLSTRVEAVILHSGCSIIHVKTFSQAYGARLVIVLPCSALSPLSALHYVCY